jgi:predicted transcriptional regulator
LDARAEQRLAERTGRGRSLLAAETIAQYLDANESQVEGVQAAIGSMDAGEGLAHEAVRRWVESWDRRRSDL